MASSIPTLSMTPSIEKHSMTLNIGYSEHYETLYRTLRTMTLSMTTPSIETISIMTLSIATLSIMAFSK
jgi:hypothetical protein